MSSAVPHSTRSVVRPWPGLAFALHRRSLAVGLALALACLALTALALTTGTYALGPAALLQTLRGHADAQHTFIVLDLRLPRALVALGAGAALACAGAIFQSLSRNPLASPDIIGFSTGAATGALTVILLAGERSDNISLGALAGGALTCALLWLLAWRRQITGQGLILAGIAIAALLAAVNDYLLTRADLDQALQARMWLHGSLQGVGWPQVRRLAMGAALALPVALWLAPRLRLLEMGDDVATSLGLRLGTSKAGLVLLAVGLTALAIASVGPIGFIALAAPQLARRLSRAPGAGLAVASLMGATLCAAADLIARHALAPFQIPVGLVTSALGGAYLVYLLAREWRRSS